MSSQIRLVSTNPLSLGSPHLTPVRKAHRPKALAATGPATAPQPGPWAGLGATSLMQRCSVRADKATLLNAPDVSFLYHFCSHTSSIPSHSLPLAPRF